MSTTINGLLNSTEIEIYLNPTEGNFTIALFDYSESYSIEITNALGQLIIEEFSSDNEHNIKTMNWSNGE